MGLALELEKEQDRLRLGSSKELCGNLTPWDLNIVDGTTLFLTSSPEGAPSDQETNLVKGTFSQGGWHRVEPGHEGHGIHRLRKSDPHHT